MIKNEYQKSHPNWKFGTTLRCLAQLLHATIPGSGYDYCISRNRYNGKSLSGEPCDTNVSLYFVFIQRFKSVRLVGCSSNLYTSRCSSSFKRRNLSSNATLFETGVDVEVTTHLIGLLHQFKSIVKSSYEHHCNVNKWKSSIALLLNFYS